MNASIDTIQTANHRLRALLDQVEEAAMIVAAKPIRAPGPRVFYVNAHFCGISGYSFEDATSSTLDRLHEGDSFMDFLFKISSLDVNEDRCEISAKLLCADGSLIQAVWKVRLIHSENKERLNFLITLKTKADRKDEAPMNPEPEARGARLVLPPIGSGCDIFLQETDPEPEPPRHSSSPFTDEDDDDIRVVTVIDDAGEAGRIENESIHLDKSRMESLALVASGIAHDFNNILTTVIANLSMAKLDSTLGTTLRDHIDDAAKAAQGAKGLTEQLLAFARGGKKERREDADLGAILKDAAKLSTYGASVRCELGVSESLWSSTIDVTQITQVINNLLINARQAMKDSGVIQANLTNDEIHESSALDLKPGKYLRLDVIDHGCGISPENVDRIFDAFFTTKKTGTGLGLATCQSIVRKHGGTIKVESTQGVGTQFSVFLPASGRAVCKETETSPGQIYKGEGTILVVDDQDDVRAVATAMLRRLGYDVVGAADGEQAVQLYKRRMNEGHPFACVLMDMTLPGGMSGRETTDEIRKLDPFAQTIASSGYFDDTATENCARDGFVGILCKPYDLEKLSFALHKVLKSS